MTKMPPEILELLAEKIHDRWSAKRKAEGWTYGKERNEPEKQHPGLVLYCELPEEEKGYDRATVLETIKALDDLGYKIVIA